MSFDPDLYRRTIKLETRVTDGVPLTMSVVDAGPRDALRTLVFLHGMGGFAAYWSHQLKHLYEGSRVIAPDLRGHGLSDAPHSQYSCDELLADIEALIDRLDLPPRFILICHSFGGALGTLYAHRHPERVEKFIIIGSAVRFDKLKNMGRFLLRAPSWLLTSALRVLPFGKRYPPGHVIHAQYKNAVLLYDGTPYLPSISCPALVILGERDRLFDSRDYQAIAKLIPGAQEVTMPLSAHQVMVERPDAVNRAIDRFLGPVQVAEERQLRRAKQEALEAERPWLKFYDGRTPYQIRPPQGPLQRHLEIAARRFPKIAALQFMHTRMSYKRLDRLANRFAEGLRRQGLQRGERVVLLLPNIPQAVIAYFAVLKAGAVVVFLNADTPAEVLMARLHELQASMLIALSTRYAELIDRPFYAGVRKVIFTAYREYMGLYDWLLFSVRQHYRQGHRMPLLKKLQSNRRVFRFYELLSLRADERPEPEPLVDALALIQYTAGTDDDSPKAVMLTHRNLMANALQIRHWIPEARPGAERILAIWPFSAGLASTVNLAPMLGGTVILLPRFEPLETLHAIKQHKPTIMPAAPRMYQLLSLVPQVRKYGIASIRVCVSAGFSLPLEVQESFEKLTKGRVIEAYNTVECGACFANPLAARKRSGAMGVPLPDVQARLTQPETGQSCAVNEVGKLWIRGPQVMAGYWQSEGLSKERLQDGWFDTGDLARCDADGFFYFVERQANTVTFKQTHMGLSTTIYPKEIEDVLYERQEILEVAVVAEQSDLPEPRIAAFIILKPQQSLEVEQLLQWCRSRIQAPSCPTQILVIAALPRNAHGKVRRRELLSLLDSSSSAKVTH